ncbi:uncharacterized protein MKS88_000300 [Plasmodium brasilianum]|uniref:uncharacterized protein n=1 Tax=Plasmodium brasilianum TaxID=5824 RepID=UPI00350E3808|nr:hypothetical protein MKS88_000300 [Plasmodium brasilianum]
MKQITKPVLFIKISEFIFLCCICHLKNIIRIIKYPIENCNLARKRNYNNGMFDRKHFFFKNKRIKKKDYDNFLERDRKICDIYLSKIRFRKYRIGVAMFFIFLLLGIGVPVLSSLSFLKEIWETITISRILNTLKMTVEGCGKNVLSYLIIVIFIVLIVMLAFMLIVGFYNILRNNEKYNKIKLIKE